MSARKFHPCKCGCGENTGSRHRKWVDGHYTARVRSARWRQTRGGQVMQKRAEAFKAEVDNLSRRLTKEDLLALFQNIYERGYRAGYLTGAAASLRDRQEAA